MSKIRLGSSAKKEITKEFNRLKAFGYEVITFNSNRPLRGQQKGFVDHFIFNVKFVVFVEVKIGNDKLSEIQERTMLKLSAASVFNKNMDYKTVKDVNGARQIVDNLLKGNL